MCNISKGRRCKDISNNKDSSQSNSSGNSKKDKGRSSEKDNSRSNKNVSNSKGSRRSGNLRENGIPNLPVSNVRESNSVKVNHGRKEDLKEGMENVEDSR